MPRILGTLAGYAERISSDLERAGLTPAPFDDIAPIAIYFWADLAYKPLALKAIGHLRSSRHPVIAAFQDDDAKTPPKVLSAMSDHPDRWLLMLLYKDALCREISRHIDQGSWEVRRDTDGSLGIVGNDEAAFGGEYDDRFAWYASAQAVAQRCTALNQVSPEMSR